MISFILSATAVAFQDALTPSAKPAVVRFGAFIEQLDGRPNTGFAAYDAAGKLWTIPTAGSALAMKADAARVAESLGQCDARGSESSGIAFAPDGSFYVIQQDGNSVNHHSERDLVSDGLGNASSYLGFGSPFAERGAALGQLRGSTGLAFHSHRKTPSFKSDPPAGLLVVDTLNHRISAFDVDDKPVRTFGTFGSGDGQLNHPNDVAIDDSGAAYVADVGNDRIVKFDATGKFVKSFGGRGSQPGLFAAPTGVDVHGQELYVADRDNHRIEVFDLDGNYVYEWGVHALLPREGQGKLHYPTDVAVSPKGDRVAVVEPMEDRVQIFGVAQENTVLTTGERDTSAHFGGHCSVRRDVFAICEPSGPSVSIFDLTRGHPIEITRFGRSGSGAGRMLRPTSVLLDDKAEIVYVADPFAYRISAYRIERKRDEPLRFDPFLAQFVRSVDLTANDLPLRGTWNIEPNGMALGDRGEILVADGANDRVVVFDSNLVPIRAFANGSAVDAKGIAFDRVSGLTAVTSDTQPWGGSVRTFARDGSTGAYLSATNSFGVAWIDASSAWFTNRVFGELGKLEFTGVRGVRFPPPTLAPLSKQNARIGRGEFVKPEGVTIDEHGRVYVVDAGNHRFQILDADGKYLDMFGARFFTEAGRTPAPMAQPANAWDGAQSVTTNDGSWRVLWRARAKPIPRGTPFAIDAWVFAAGEPKTPARNVSLGVDAWMPDHLHGMTRVPRIVPRDDGGFTIEGLSFHMSGRWELDFDVVSKSIAERATVRVDLE